MNGIALGPSTTEQKLKIANLNEKYRDKVSNFVSRYDTDNIVFSFNGQTLVESVNGYLDVTFETEDLKEALKQLTYEHQIQILGREDEHRTYRLGFIRTSMNECQVGTQVVDVKNLIDLV